MKNFAVFIFLLAVAYLATCNVTLSGIPDVICGSENITVTSTGVTGTGSTFSVVPNTQNVIVKPSIFALTSAQPNVVLNISCNSITPVSFTFYDESDNSTVATFYSYCKGMMYIVNPTTSIVRGNDFSTTLFLLPVPTEVVDIMVTVDTPLIIPGSDRLTFGIGQYTENVVFYAPAGEVGPTNIHFNSRSLRDYSGPNCKELVMPVTVLGTITTDVHAKTISDGIYTNVTVTIHPPALAETVYVYIDNYQMGEAVPSVLEFPPGSDTAVFRILPTLVYYPAIAPFAVTFTSPYYDTLVEEVFVIGTIFTSTPSSLPLGTSDIIVSILPGASNETIIVYTESSSNVEIQSTIEFPPGISLKHVSVTTYSEGSGYILFSAPGFAQQKDVFDIYSVTCSYYEVLNEDGTGCVECPVNPFTGSICSSSGACTYSETLENSGRCVCYSFNTGSSCEFDNFFYTYTQEFGVDGGNFSFNNIFDLKDVSLEIFPYFVEQNMNPFYYGQGIVSIVDTGRYWLNDPVEPYTYRFSDFIVTPMNLGFFFDVSFGDNTPFPVLEDPIWVTVTFMPEVTSQTEFLESVLYYYDETSGSFVPAASVCESYYKDQTEDLLSLTRSQFLCAIGQYEFFTKVPIPQDLPVDPVYVYNDYDYSIHVDTTTTGGAGGIQGNLPPQPNLPVPDMDPSPPRANTAAIYKAPSRQDITFTTEDTSSAQSLAYLTSLILVVLFLL